MTWHWLASASGQTAVALSRLSTPSMVNDFHDVERGSVVQKPPASAFRVETQTPDCGGHCDSETSETVYATWRTVWSSRYLYTNLVGLKRAFYCVYPPSRPTRGESRAGPAPAPEAGRRRAGADGPGPPAGGAVSANILSGCPRSRRRGRPAGRRRGPRLAAPPLRSRPDPGSCIVAYKYTQNIRIRAVLNPSNPGL